MAASPFFAPIFAQLDTALATYVDVVATRMYNVITPVSKLMVVIVVVIFGYQMMFGSVQQPLRDGVLRIVRISVILGLIQVGSYHTYIADFFMTAPDQLAAAITGASPESNVHFLDSLWDQQKAFADAFWNKGVANGLAGLGYVLFAIGLYVVALLSSGAAALFLLVAKAGLYSWLAFGSLFVLLAMFEATKQYTNAWLGQVVTFALLPMLVGGVIYLILSLGKAYLLAINGIGAMADPAIDQGLKYIFVGGGAAYFLKQIPSFASGLGGGVALSTLGAASAAMRIAGGGVGGAKNLMTGQTLSDMRGARRQRARNAEWAKENPGLAKRTAGMPMKAYRALTTPRKNTVTKS